MPMSDAEKQIDLQGLRRLNDELIETVEQQQKAIEQLREELALFRNRFFGKSSERHIEDDSQLHLFEINDEPNDGELEEGGQGQGPRKRRRRKKKSEKIPPHLRREIIEADVASQDRVCPCCGDEMPIIGTDISERVDLVPAELFVWEIRRHKRACCKCKESVAQVPAGEEPGGLTTPVPGSDYGFGVYTQIIVNKFADHLPLYRGEDIFARAGMFIPRNTQFGMLANIATLISPLVALMKSRIVHSLDVWAYVDDCVRQLAGGSVDYESLLPDVWRATHPESIRVYRDAEKKSRRLTTQQRRVRRRAARVA